MPAGLLKGKSKGEILKFIDKKAHLTEWGIQSIVNLRASLNLGLSEVLQLSFPNTIPVPRPVVPRTEVPHPQWMAGFISG